jgi:hypothetical protein
MLVCDQTDQKYIGVRLANKIPASSDTQYMSSSKIVKDMISEGFTFTKQILAEWDSVTEAINHEIFLHSCFDVGKNPNFLNKSKQTSTGFTGCGLKGKPNGRRGVPNPAISKKLKGKPKPAVSAALSGRRRPDISAKLKGKPNPKTGQALKGRNLSINTRTAMSIAKKGKSPNNKGKKLSEITCIKMSNARMGKNSPTKGKVYEKRECSHCSVVGGGPQMTRFHFENCKFNSQRDLTIFS